MRLKKNKIANTATSKTPRKIFLVFFFIFLVKNLQVPNLFHIFGHH